MINKQLFYYFPVLLFFIICCSAQKTDTDVKLSKTGNIKAKEYLALINEINNASPSTIKTSFTADGNMGEKKFRVEGKVLFDKKGYYRLSISDYIFRTAVLDAYRELDTLYFFYPVEKKLLIDDYKKINLSMYTGFEADYKFIYSVFSGGIPLLEKSSVYNCLYDEKEKGYYLILENSGYFENIFFRNDIPEKILIIHKQSRDKAEIYLKSMIKKDKAVFFKNYRIVIPANGVSININFPKPVLNGAVSVEKINMNRLPKKTEIIKVN